MLSYPWFLVKTKTTQEVLSLTEMCITVQELSKRLHISRSAAYQLASAASFYPAFRLGKRVLIRVAELEKWLAEQA